MYSPTFNRNSNFQSLGDLTGSHIMLRFRLPEYGFDTFKIDHNLRIGLTKAAGLHQTRNVSKHGHLTREKQPAPILG